MVIFAGDVEIGQLHSFLSIQRLKPEYVLLTHEHFDHCWGCNHYSELPVVCTSPCSDNIRSSQSNLSFYFDNKGFAVKSDSMKVDIMDNSLIWHGNHVRFFPVKGHSPGGMLITAGHFLFSGDTLIKDLKTVVKLKGGSRDELLIDLSLIKSFVGNNYTVYAGHGDSFELDIYDMSKAL